MERQLLKKYKLKFSIYIMKKQKERQSIKILEPYSSFFITHQAYKQEEN